MDKNSNTMKKRIDALDTLREWLKVEGPPYGSLKPTMTVRGNIVTDIYINRGDEVIHLRKDTMLRKHVVDEDSSEPIDEDFSKSHI